MKTIPMCWKCREIKTTNIGVPGFPTMIQMVGCKACPEIKDYEDAKELCPLLKEERDNG